MLSSCSLLWPSVAPPMDLRSRGGQHERDRISPPSCRETKKSSRKDNRNRQKRGLCSGRGRAHRRSEVTGRLFRPRPSCHGLRLSTLSVAVPAIGHASLPFPRVSLSFLFGPSGLSSLVTRTVYTSYGDSCFAVWVDPIYKGQSTANAHGLCDPLANGKKR